MLIKKRPEKLRSYTPTKTKKERQTVRNSHRKFSVKLNTEKFQLSKLYFKFDFYIRNYFELKLFKNRDIVYVHCPRDFLRAGILHPSALEIALGQSLGPRGAKSPPLVNLLGLGGCISQYIPPLGSVHIQYIISPREGQRDISRAEGNLEIGGDVQPNTSRFQAVYSHSLILN